MFGNSSWGIFIKANWDIFSTTLWNQDWTKTLFCSSPSQRKPATAQSYKMQSWLIYKSGCWCIAVARKWQFQYNCKKKRSNKDGVVTKWQPDWFSIAVASCGASFRNMASITFMRVAWFMLLSKEKLQSAQAVWIWCKCQEIHNNLLSASFTVWYRENTTSSLCE